MDESQIPTIYLTDDMSYQSNDELIQALAFNKKIKKIKMDTKLSDKKYNKLVQVAQREFSVVNPIYKKKIIGIFNLGNCISLILHDKKSKTIACACIDSYLFYTKDEIESAANFFGIKFNAKNRLSLSLNNMNNNRHSCDNLPNIKYTYQTSNSCDNINLKNVGNLENLPSYSFINKNTLQSYDTDQINKTSSVSSIFESTNQYPINKNNTQTLDDISNINNINNTNKDTVFSRLKKEISLKGLFFDAQKIFSPAEYNMDYIIRTMTDHGMNSRNNKVRAYIIGGRTRISENIIKNTVNALKFKNIKLRGINILGGDHCTRNFAIDCNGNFYNLDIKYYIQHPDKNPLKFFILFNNTN
jgi:chemotaxis receptor (MCP) glutamine deamidase CheD